MDDAKLWMVDADRLITSVTVKCQIIIDFMSHSLGTQNGTRDNVTHVPTVIRQKKSLKVDC